MSKIQGSVDGINYFIADNKESITALKYASLIRVNGVVFHHQSEIEALRKERDELLKARIDDATESLFLGFGQEQAKVWKESIEAPLRQERDKQKERDEWKAELSACEERFGEYIKEYQNTHKIKKERDEYRADLEKAIQYLREGKAKLAPHTTNSFVDDLLAKYPKDKP